jgi:quercetin dioxygenase-like cupin family protein
MSIFSEAIQDLPRAAIPFDGVTGYLSQGRDHQIVFLDFEHDLNLPAHSHAEQWGVILAGRIDLTFNGIVHRLTAGDHYTIPAGVEHSAHIRAGSAAMDFYAEPARWKTEE